MFEVKCLTETQAWSLFEAKIRTSTIDGRAGIREQADKITRECNGLPLALITTTARTMASKKTLQNGKMLCGT